MTSFTSSVIGAATGKPEGVAEANPIIEIIGPLLAQFGGLQGLMNKFSQAGLGNVFSSWVKTGPNPPVSGQQIEQVFGSDQIKALGAEFGINPAQISEGLAEHLPSAVDHLTPEGKIDPTVNIQQQLATFLPSLLQKFEQQTAEFGGPQS